MEVSKKNIKKIDFRKGGGLVPVIVQHADSRHVLMLGYMNEEALEKTRKTGRITFYSRSKKRLWTKGESSGNFLTVKKIEADCDRDTLLISAIPKGIVCHLGTDTCFGNRSRSQNFMKTLERIIARRKNDSPKESYTARLFNRGLNKIAQKVGEEAVEVIIEAKDNDRDKFVEESADLLYHLLVLLKAKDVPLAEVECVLEKRHRGKTKKEL